MPRIVDNFLGEVPSINPLPPAPPPEGPLGRYRLLSPTASIRVSPLCLGSINFGEAWESYSKSPWIASQPILTLSPVGVCNEQTTEEILDYFFEKGGNFIDTSSNYQFEDSEKRIGAWMKKRNNRDQMVIATKYTMNYQAVDVEGGHTPKQRILVNYSGNGSKSMRVSVEASLSKLQTGYIDIVRLLSQMWNHLVVTNTHLQLYLHLWDFSVSIPELMQSLNHLVASGKVLYLGISDTPAWVVSKANEYARSHGLRQFSIYQGRWSAADRDFEREIIQMCRAEGMALAPWGVLGGGKFKTEAQRQEAKKDGRAVQPSETDILVSKALEAVAKRKNTLVTSVALAYVCSKANYVFPIVGGRTVEHLKGNIEALNVRLSEGDIKEIDEAVPFDLGFPLNFIFGASLPGAPGDTWILKLGGTHDHVLEPKPFARE